MGRWTNARRDLTEACDALGIPSCSPNDLRRSYATWLGQADIRDELIAKAMGHAPTTVLGKHYRKLSDEDLLRLMEEEYARAVHAMPSAPAEVPAPETRGPGPGDVVPRDGIALSCTEARRSTGKTDDVSLAAEPPGRRRGSQQRCPSRNRSFLYGVSAPYRKDR